MLVQNLQVYKFYEIYVEFTSLQNLHTITITTLQFSITMYI